MQNIEIMAVMGLPLIQKGDDIASLVCERITLHDGDIISLASTICSKAKGYTRLLSSITATRRAQDIALFTGEDPRFVQAVLDASSSLLMERPFVLSELSWGHIGVRAGIDQSNIEDGKIILLPPDPMGLAAELRTDFMKKTGKIVSVIITDTCGRSFRRGQTGHAIGWSGIFAIRDFRGDTDLFGRILKITEEAVVDEIAGFSNFIMGESKSGIPAVVFRNCPKWVGHDNLYFSKEEDVIRTALERERLSRTDTFP